MLSQAPALPCPGSFPGLCPTGQGELVLAVCALPEGLSGPSLVPEAGAEQLQAPAASCAAPSPALGLDESRARWVSHPALSHDMFLGTSPASSSSLCPGSLCAGFSF